MPVTATWRSPLAFPEAEAIAEATPALLGRVAGADPGRVLLIDGTAGLAGDVDAVCLLMFTSGTTGRPKGVLHSHRTLLADAQSIADLYRMRGDVVYMPSPVGHVTGLVYGVLMPLLMDGSCVLQAEWDA